MVSCREKGSGVWGWAGPSEVPETRRPQKAQRTPVRLCPRPAPPAPRPPPGSASCQEEACISSRKTQRRPVPTRMVGNKHYETDTEKQPLCRAWPGRGEDAGRRVGCSEPPPEARPGLRARPRGRHGPAGRARALFCNLGFYGSLLVACAPVLVYFNIHFAAQLAPLLINTFLTLPCQAAVRKPGPAPNRRRSPLSGWGGAPLGGRLPHPRSPA